MSKFSFFKQFLGVTRTDKKLNSQEALRLVDLVFQAPNLDAAIAAAEAAFSFLVGQLHILGDSANGYPRNPVNAHVWAEGYSLANTCDRFADAVAGWNQRRGEEQATRLAAMMALQIVAHYPEEIFPRVLRNAVCCEALGMMSEAIEGYGSIVGDFDRLRLEEILDSSEPFTDSEIKILTSVHHAFIALQRLSPEGLSATQHEICERLNAILDSLPKKDVEL
jgi:hypothetical protein